MCAGQSSFCAPGGVPGEVSEVRCGENRHQSGHGPERDGMIEASPQNITKSGQSVESLFHAHCSPSVFQKRREGRAKLLPYRLLGHLKLARADPRG